MLTTEQEASERWCPFTRVIAIKPDGNAVSPAFNRTIQGSSIETRAPEATLSIPQAAQCIGSNCMMWRWLDNETTRDGDPVTGRRGFCGLAMNPLTYQH